MVFAGLWRFSMIRKFKILQGFSSRDEKKTVNNSSLNKMIIINELNVCNKIMICFIMQVPREQFTTSPITWDNSGK